MPDPTALAPTLVGEVGVGGGRTPTGRPGGGPGGVEASAQQVRVFLGLAHDEVQLQVQGLLPLLFQPRLLLELHHLRRPLRLSTQWPPWMTKGHPIPPNSHQMVTTGNQRPTPMTYGQRG